MNKQLPLTIVATQGYPYTGKTTLVNALAKRLKFSTVRLDDILDFVIPPGEPLPTPQKANAVKSHAFDLLIQTVKTQISLGLSVIVDSDLSRRSYLHKLTALQTQVKDQDIRIVIIECNPKTTYTWEMRFNQRDSSYNSKWYKPQNQQLDPEFKRDYTDEHLGVCIKLIVNTTSYIEYDHVADAVRDLVTTTDCSTMIMDLEKWRRQHNNSLQTNSDLSRKTKLNKINKHFCRNGRHCVNEYNQYGIDYYATCEVCEKVIQIGVDATYTCSFCPLAIHRSCAEAGIKSFLPENFPEFFEISRILVKPVYFFPEEHLCLRCIVEGNDFTYKCEGCVFQCHLRCGLLPTILDHRGHGGRLFFSMSNEYKYMCAACKRLGKYASYGCVKDCNIHYHPKCAVLPFSIEHVHGGHAHGLRLVFRREEELEDYICHLCFKEMSPDAWYYNCKSCYLDLHLDCAFEEF